MVKLLIGHKGSGKTGQMIQLANDSVETSNGSIIFINKNQRLMYELKHSIRVICMEDYEHITNIDEYIGFVYGIISSDHDIEVIFIDSIRLLLVYANRKIVVTKDTVTYTSPMKKTEAFHWDEIKVYSLGDNRISFELKDKRVIFSTKDAHYHDLVLFLRKNDRFAN